MDNIVSRITIVKQSDGEPSSTVVYRGKRKSRRNTWSRPIERAVRSLFKAQEAFGQSALSRQGKSNRRRREGWVVDAPVNLYEASRKAYNQARKGIPFTLLPRM